MIKMVMMTDHDIWFYVRLCLRLQYLLYYLNQTKVDDMNRGPCVTSWFQPAHLDIQACAKFRESFHSQIFHPPRALFSGFYSDYPLFLYLVLIILLFFVRLLLSTYLWLLWCCWFSSSFVRLDFWSVRFVCTALTLVYLTLFQSPLAHKLTTRLWLSAVALVAAIPVHFCLVLIAGLSCVRLSSSFVPLRLCLRRRPFM